MRPWLLCVRAFLCARSPAQATLGSPAAAARRREGVIYFDGGSVLHT